MSVGGFASAKPLKILLRQAFKATNQEKIGAVLHVATEQLQSATIHYDRSN